MSIVNYLPFVVLYICSFQSTSQSPRNLPSIECRSRYDYVEVHDDYKYINPLVVKLHRCSGKTDGRRGTSCQPEVTTNVSIYVLDATLQPIITSVVNHTKCKDICVKNETSCNTHESWDISRCECKCTNATVTCPPLFYWDRHICNCLCPHKAGNYPCGQGKVFSSEACGCVCKPRLYRLCSKHNQTIDPNTCTCNVGSPSTGASESSCSNNKGTVSKLIAALVIIAEAICIVVIFYLWKKYFQCKPTPDKNLCSEESIKEGADTPTISYMPAMENESIKPLTLEKLQETKLKLSLGSLSSDTPFKDSFSRPIDTPLIDSERIKHRHDVVKSLQLCYEEAEKSSFPRNNLFVDDCQYLDVSEYGSDETFIVSDSLASVTQV